MQVLIIGGGGREHALAWKVAQSADVTQVFVAPGNAGTAQEPKIRNIDIAAGDLSQLLNFATEQDIDLTIVGPEAPLTAGIVDQFHAAGLAIFGPSQAAAQLEGSKAFCKDFLARHGIPTAAYQGFSDINAAEAYIRQQGAPIVIKADGLAAGKGVVVAMTEADAIAAAHAMLCEHAFGDAGQQIVIEAFLSGEEVSFIAMVDRNGYVLPMASSQDHKARDNRDTGPNTGGMGAYSPAPLVTPTLHARIMDEIIRPTVAGMAADGRPYCGFLYAGLMIGADGAPKVLEFNCRFGDPETQPIMLRLQSDLAALCLAATNGRLEQHSVAWDSRAALGVVMASEAYPNVYPKGETIRGLEQDFGDTVKVFHAGTAQQDNAVVTAGGRVLCVTALGESVRAAQTDAYSAVEKIHWPSAFYRTDIGYRAINQET